MEVERKVVEPGQFDVSLPVGVALATLRVADRRRAVEVEVGSRQVSLLQIGVPAQIDISVWKPRVVVAAGGQHGECTGQKQQSFEDGCKHGCRNGGGWC